MSETDVQPAQLDWDEQGQPLSQQFGDVYFSREDGLGETRHVFLEGNDLATRFAALPTSGRLVIGETGFGTGLNFLCAWQLFEQVAPANARLHMVSVEKYPLNRADLQRALSLWPELAPWSNALLHQYVAIHSGFQHFVFAQGRVVLTLLVGDVLTCLPQLDAQVDAWFLDGFSPAKNPQMWTPTLFAELARLSAPKATLGTFTSAGFVRRGLMAVGFDMCRVPGYGRKREILRGVFAPSIPPLSSKVTAAWFARPKTMIDRRQAVVIGAGVAGCATAASLAARGWQVQILERHAQPAQEGSGNPQGVLYLKLSAYQTLLSQLILSGFGFTRRLLQHLPRGQDWSDCGLLQLAFDASERLRQQQLTQAFSTHLLQPLDHAAAEACSGVHLPEGGLWFPESGWLRPPALCQWFLQHPNIQLTTHQQAFELRRIENGDWQVWSHDRLLAQAPIVVLATATETLKFTQTAHLPLKSIRGQITRLPMTDASQSLKTVLCAEGYVAPAWQAEHTLGASFNFHTTDLAVSTEEHHSNLELLKAISPDLYHRLQANLLPIERLEGRAAFRCTAPDYLPLIGPLAEAPSFTEAYKRLRYDSRLRPDIPCPWLEGLYINTAHGSRGLITAPLAAELLCAWLEEEPLPIPRVLAEACHPNRFLLRNIIRGK